MWDLIPCIMLSCQCASAALSLVSLKNEKIAECVGFSDNLIELPYNGEWTISSIVKHMDSATDCALPMLWAKEKEKKSEVFVVYTDNETWFGDASFYSSNAFKMYRHTAGTLSLGVLSHVVQYYPRSR
ncbi:unnamed protein product [Angiostrongylus costaricensis]|uniref:Beta-lactamase domain-containing protein n=1 Tax=Angiostrongylus costaricensis TaxID=334426 RepID=A0A0R3PKD3_ANGCS|nr:unnamed protein product [Angiostrongylus costaricensis]